MRKINHSFTIGDKIGHLQRTNESTSLPPSLPLPSIQSCGACCFYIASSNSGTTLHGGDEGGKALFPLLKSIKRQKAPLGQSISTNFVTDRRNSMKAETRLSLFPIR